MGFEFYYQFPPHFPLEDTMVIGERLEASGALVPGFIPPPVGLLDVRGLLYCQKVDRRTLLVLPDRNLASRMAQVARYGAPAVDNTVSRVAVDLMAFCQAMDINFEPSIAFHELATLKGNDEAHEELAWFRAADRGAAQEWIDLAAGRRTKVNLGKPGAGQTSDLALPLRRWRRNYIVALKIAELELSPSPPISKALNLFKWMWDDFMVAGSAAVFAAVYFAPNGKRKRLLKHLRSPERSRAIEGVKNAAWDFTHLSEFVARLRQADEKRERVIFATADQGLARIAPMTMASPWPSDEQVTLRSLIEGWNDKDADALVEGMRPLFDIGRERRPEPSGAGTIDDMILEGEQRLLGWR